MQHVLLANKKVLVQRCKNVVTHSTRAMKNVECAKVFLPFILQARCATRGGICPHRNFSNFDICRNFQILKMKFYILIIFRSLIGIFLCPTGKLSPYKIWLETGYLIENFVNDWYLTTNMLEVSGEIAWNVRISKAFFIYSFVYYFFLDRPKFAHMKLYHIRVGVEPYKLLKVSNWLEKS